MDHFHYTPYILPLMATCLLALVLAGAIWRRRPGVGVVPFVVLMLALAQWTLSNVFEIGTDSLDAKLFFSGIAYVGITTATAAWLAFALEYTGREKWLTRRNVLLLTIEPVIVVVLALTYHQQQIFRTDYVMDRSGAFPALDVTFAWAFWLHGVYSYVVLVVGNLLLLKAYFGATQLYREQLAMLLIAALAPWVANAIFIFGLSPFDTPFDLTPFAFVITGTVMGWSIYRYRLLDIVPVAHHFVIESIGDGIVVIDKQNRIVDANPAALSLAGRATTAHVIGHLVSEVAPHMTAVADKFRMIEEGLDEITVGVGETQRHFQMRITPLRNRHGDLIGRLFVLHEITELKRASAQIQAQNDILTRTNQELDIARQQAEEANRLKSEFLATISHELRTPLNSVIGYADLMLTIMSDSLTEKQRDYVKRIMNNGERLLTLINDILDLSKIEAGHLELVIQTIVPADLLAMVQADMQPLASQKNLAFEIVLDPALPAAVRGDPKRLQQIITNLLSNAIRFTDHGQVKVHLDRPEETLWRITVNDTGIGIPPHALEFIFDEFRQVDGSYQRQYGGTGLGLAIVRKLVTLMGGTVRVESEVGQGSTFTVQLPLDVPEGGK
jgi:PAS domain S-box-containing protein